MNRRLYLRLYATFLGITFLSLVLAAVLTRALHPPTRPVLSHLTPLAQSLSCQAGKPCEDRVATALGEMAKDMALDIVVWDGGQQPVFSAVQKPFPPPANFQGGWRHSPRGPVWLVELGEGRMLGVREHAHFGPRGFLWPMLIGLAVLMAIGLHPLSRGITRRLEHLSEGANRWAAGDLDHRVPVEGKDEVAALTARFNQAAGAIQELLAHERQMLATASHELRTPLARVRMALELLGEEADAAKRLDLAQKASADVMELDDLVEELLLSARAQPSVPRRPFTAVDLLALARDEAEKTGATVVGESVVFPCDASMIRHLLRNLLANAKVHGGGASVRIEVRRGADQVLIAVEDDGPGVPQGEREAIFRPFYRAPGPRPPGDTGLGLGLALVRQVARYHGGEVRHVPREPRGSRFETRLPSPTRQ